MNECNVNHRKTCKYCNKKVLQFVQCYFCENVYHPSCFERKGHVLNRSTFICKTCKNSVNIDGKVNPHIKKPKHDPKVCNIIGISIQITIYMVTVKSYG